MLNYSIALCSVDIPIEDLAAVAVALQTQAGHFQAAWGVTATITTCQTVDQKPPGSWGVVVTQEFNTNGEEGIHIAPNNQPIAFVRPDEHWVTTASHEMLEMMADPFGNRLITAPALNGPPHPVQYLMEVCDPVQFSTYPIGSFQVCNFVSPAFFHPPLPGERYDFNNQIRRPLQILSGGYLTFQDSGFWCQARADQNGNLSFQQGPPIGSGPPSLSARELTHAHFKTYELRPPTLGKNERRRRQSYTNATKKLRADEAAQLRSMFPFLSRINDSLSGKHPEPSIAKPRLRKRKVPIA